MSLRRPPASSLQRHGGQVALEFVLSLAGLVMFIYVVLQTWMWLTGTVVHRQESFQATRLAAGQVATAGMRVPYARAPITLLGSPQATSGVPGLGGGPPPLPPPPCAAAVPFFDQATELYRLGRERQEEAFRRLTPMGEEWRANEARLGAIAQRIARVEGLLRGLGCSEVREGGP